MRLRRRVISRLRVPLLVLAATAALAPTSALAATHRQDLRSPDARDAAALGARGPTTRTPEAIVGDTPADFPGVGRARTYSGPTTVEVVRPERTIVRDVDEALPIALAALALLVALGGAGYVLVRTRSRWPAEAGGTH
jgi:hypothetical protein